MQIERLPRFNENMDSATVVRPIVKEGDEIQVGSVLFEMLTEKAEFEYTSNVSGRIIAVLAGEKDEVPVGYVLLVTGTEAEKPRVEELRRENRRILDTFVPGGHDKKPLPFLKAKSAPQVAVSGDRIRATPGARRLAKEKGVDLAIVKAEIAVEGIVREEHIEQFLVRKGGKR
jgi:pyruvate dehydrogenase E2 component (dihydrolipoamide acetyltransferase)